MRRFKKILFLAGHGEGEESVLTRAARLASANGAKLMLFDALPAEGYRFSDPATGAAVDAINQAHLDERRKELEDLRQSVSAEFPQLDVGVEVHTGDRAVSVIQAVLRDRHDLVMKAAEGGGGRLKRLFGSTGQRLMRKCPCPVWIVKPSKEHYFTRILAAVDLDPTRPETESLARKIMELGTSLAKEEESELHVVHVWQLSGETVLRGRSIDTTQVDQIVRDMQAAHQSELDGLLEHYPYDKRTAHLIKGDAGDVIPAFAEKLGVDLVVIGTVGRSGVPGLLIGNTAEKVLDAVDCSVLTLKPEGFETPIQP